MRGFVTSASNLFNLFVNSSSRLVRFQEQTFSIACPEIRWNIFNVVQFKGQGRIRLTRGYLMISFASAWPILSLGPTGPVLSIDTRFCNTGYGSILPEHKMKTLLQYSSDKNEQFYESSNNFFTVEVACLVARCPMVVFEGSNVESVGDQWRHANLPLTVARLVIIRHASLK